MKTSKLFGFIFSGILIGLIHESIRAQDYKAYGHSYHAHELDYFPHFRSYKLSNTSLCIKNEDDFNSTLGRIIKSCSAFKSIEKISGIFLSNVGLISDSLLSKKWLTIYIDQEGKVFDVIFRNVEHSDQIELCLKELIDGYNLKPALINNLPVKSHFAFILE